MKSSAFAALGLEPSLVRAVMEEGYDEPTPIQTAVVSTVLEGRDLIACAQTGTGKTAAFVLPLLQILAAKPRSGAIRALILTPTRELAAQIAERISVYGRHLGLKHLVVYGGVSQLRQEAALENIPDFLVATPGRLLDLMGQRKLSLGGVECFVLDEADRMLDMGFVRDVQKIAAAVPKRRQTLLFSATIPREIEDLAQSMLVNPARVSVTPSTAAAVTIDQAVIFVQKADKRARLEQLLNEPQVFRSIVFTRTKHGANRLAEQLVKSGIEAAAIHGNKSQGARERALEGFKDGTTRVLVATDIAARGIDVEAITHVINYELPNVPESYVHRIGRTGRAGATGIAIALCDEEERALLTDIEKLLGKRVPVIGDEPAWAKPGAYAPRPPTGQNQNRGPRPGGQRPSGPRQGGGGARPAGAARSSAGSGRSAGGGGGGGRGGGGRGGSNGGRGGGW